MSGSCYGLWLNVVDSYCVTKAVSRCDNDSTNASGPSECHTSGQTMKCGSDWADGTDTWGGNICGQTPAIDASSGCRCCGLCCGGFGPGGYPYANHNCPNGNLPNPCTGMFNFGGSVEDIDDFNIG